MGITSKLFTYDDYPLMREAYVNKLTMSVPSEEP